MKKILTAAILSIAVSILMTAVPAQAQATRTWISGVGDDLNPCSRTAPCKTFPGAISKTAAGGEIDTLDPGGFGAVTVTKSITLADEGVGEGGILVAGTNGITVNCTTDPNCTVVVRGLQIDGGPLPSSNSLNGIRFIAGGHLIIQNCVIRNFNGGSPNGFGISFQPSATQTATLVVTDTTISSNGITTSSTTGTGGGINIQPSGASNVQVTLNNVNAVNNGNNALNIDGAAQTNAGKIFVSSTNSRFDGSVIGVNLNGPGGTGAVTTVLQGNTISHNSRFGLAATGARATVFFGTSVITDNNKGVFANSSPTMNSYSNNEIDGNATPNSAFTTSALQ